MIKCDLFPDKASHARNNSQRHQYRGVREANKNSEPSCVEEIQQVYEKYLFKNVR